MTQQAKDKMLVASGSSYGAIAHDEHARKAVNAAVAKMAPCTIGSVLLFLTSGYAHNPQNAIKEAAKSAGTPQVFGCCAMGLLTEEEWLLDVEGAVAMVFPSHLGLRPLTVLQQHGIDPSLVLTLATPNAATIAVNSCDQPQTGAVTTDEYGHGPFSVWQSGRIIEQEFVQCAYPNSLINVTHVAEGVRAISPIMQVNRAKGHCLIEVDQMSATDNLSHHLPENLHAVGLKQPYNLLCAISENNDINSIKNGHFKLHHVVSSDLQNEHINVSGTIKAGRYLFWGLRDEQHAQAVIEKELTTAKAKLGKQPLFGLMFPNIGRGSEFFNGRDRDLELFQDIFPDTPLIGFYGNGEIAPGQRLSGLIHRYATVFSLFA